MWFFFFGKKTSNFIDVFLLSALWALKGSLISFFSPPAFRFYNLEPSYVYADLKKGFGDSIYQAFINITNLSSRLDVRNKSHCSVKCECIGSHWINWLGSCFVFLFLNNKWFITSLNLHLLLSPCVSVTAGAEQEAGRFLCFRLKHTWTPTVHITYSHLISCGVELLCFRADSYPKSHRAALHGCSSSLVSILMEGESSENRSVKEMWRKCSYLNDWRGLFVLLV